MIREYFLIVLVVVVFIFLWQINPPASFPIGEIITVEEGDGLLELSERLEQDKVIRSPAWFRIAAITFGGERDMKAGQYYMARPQSVFVLAWRILHGKHDIETVKLTIPEGFTVARIGGLFDERFENFDHEEFMRLAREGYLFPDTYFIPISATASVTIKFLNDNFERKISRVMQDIENSQHSLEEIVIMASILESEARIKEDRILVSGVLWKRIRLGLPLQVDASLTYLNGKTSKELTRSDLQIDSPFNTYKYSGLPPTPISNPGFESIRAAIYPEESSYLFFLTGDDGTMHYSEDFDEHVTKKSKYIK